METTENNPSDLPSTEETKRFRVGWLNATLDAEYWFGEKTHPKPREAAMLLCRLNPLSEKNPEIASSDETKPEDFKRLLHAFEGMHGMDNRPRTLLEWRNIARKSGLKYHSWVDFYEQAAELPKTSDNTDGAEQTNKGKLDRFDVFRSMDVLHPSEVTITLCPDDMIEVAARSKSIRVHIGLANFIDGRNGNHKASFVILRELAEGKPLTDAKRGKAVSDFRKHLKRLFGFKQDPFFRYNEADGWKPRCKLIDNRSTADVYSRGALSSFDALGEEQVFCNTLSSTNLSNPEDILIAHEEARMRIKTSRHRASDADQNDDQNDEAARWLKERDRSS